MVRPGRRSAGELGLGRKLMDYIRRNKALLKGRNCYFRTLADRWGEVSDKTMKRLATQLDGTEVDGITLHTWKINGNPFIHFNPPGSDEEGYWPWFPAARIVIEDVTTLAIRGELLKRWDERPRLFRLGLLR